MTARVVAAIHLPLPNLLEVLPLEDQGWRVLEGRPLLGATSKAFCKCKDYEAQDENEEAEEGTPPFPSEPRHAGVVHLTDIWDIDSETPRADSWYG